MSDVIASTASRLRERAASYRAQAETAMSSGLARELIRMADEWDDDAGRLALKARRERPERIRRDLPR